MRLAISMGDPSGVGPEVILKALADGGIPVDFTPVVFGSPQIIHRDAGLLSRSEAIRSRLSTVDEVADLDDRSLSDDAIAVVDVAPDLETHDIGYANTDSRCARMQLRAFKRAIEAVRQGDASASVTAPWTKSLFRTIDRAPTGHTEILRDTFPDAQAVMMLAGPRLRVSLATTHVALRDVSDVLDRNALERAIRITAESLQSRFDVSSPEIAVCGLNPHAGERGAIGHEEQNLIEPTVGSLQEELSCASLHGPFPSDTLFMRFRQGEVPFDAVVCMYHDQGLIPLKLLHFGESANITLGLPIIRTSVDHGTAYDIAGQGVADAGSMRYALRTAVQMAGSQ